MKKIISLMLVMVSSLALADGKTFYQVSFDNAAHHEAQISVTFSDIRSTKLEVQMSRSSPGRYALHEFAKNVYNVSAVNSQGMPIEITRPNPYQWHIEGHDGEVTVTYTLFGDRADGTYTQIDRTHAHLNMPASFMWATGHEAREIEIEFSPYSRHWKVATQLPQGNNKYQFTAPNLSYFMDSPTELSNHDLRSWQVSSNGRTQTIKLAVHHDGIKEDVDKLAAMAKAVVDEQVKLYGELPRFDYGEYTFIACYLPHVNNDGMEHRNSTILTKSVSLDEGEFKSHLSTLSHEFFHAWNVERIRPKELEPFDFSGPNMTPNLWFAEGFTSYFDKLTIRRAQQSTIEEYLDVVSSMVNQANQVPGRLYFSPEGASMLATFTDAGTSIDQTNFKNIFFSYYIYGRARGLALDLAIRHQFPGKSLNDLMKHMWVKYGKSETPYTREDLRHALGEIVGDQNFADRFFAQYIQGQAIPNYEELLAPAGLIIKKVDEKSAFLGKVEFNFRGQDAIVSNRILVGTPLYKAGIEKGDQIVKLGRRTIRSAELWDKALKQFEPDDTTTIEFIQRGETITKQIRFTTDPTIEVKMLDPDAMTTEQSAFLTSWIGEDKPK